MPEPRWRPRNERKPDPEQSYDDSHTQNFDSRLPQAGSLEITARYDCRSRRAQSPEDGDSSPIAGGNWDKGPRNMDVAGPGTGPWPGALARGRTAVAAGLRAGAGNSESAARIAAGQPRGERQPNVAAGDRNYSFDRPPHDRANCGRRGLARGVGDGLVDQSELDAVLANYWPTSPWLQITNLAGLGATNITFALTNSNAPAGPQRYYRLR